MSKPQQVGKKSKEERPPPRAALETPQPHDLQPGGWEEGTKPPLETNEGEASKANEQPQPTDLKTALPAASRIRARETTP